jgi:hypothetical protein
MSHLRRDPGQLVRPALARDVFQSDEALIAGGSKNLQHGLEVDFARPGADPSRRVGELNMAEPGGVAMKGLRHIAFDELKVICVELDPDVRVVDLADDVDSFAREVSQ